MKIGPGVAAPDNLFQRTHRTNSQLIFHKDLQKLLVSSPVFCMIGTVTVLLTLFYRQFSTILFSA